MGRHFLTCLLLSFAGCLPMLRGQSSEYMLKAGFIERFTRFIEWPADSIRADSTKPFIILVLGKNPFDDNLDRFFSKTRINGRKVIVRYASRPDTNNYYHMIFIGNMATRDLRSVLKYTQNKPIITVGDTEGFCSQGVLINFFIENNRIRFEINQEAFRKTGLKVSHLLLNTARII